MNKRSLLDISSYLILGPENTKNRPVPDIVRAALVAGFTCLQVRSKTATAREMLALARACAEVRAELGLADRVALHQGTIRVESEPGQGTRFIVELRVKFKS